MQRPPRIQFIHQRQGAISIKFSIRFLLVGVLIVSVALAFFVRRRAVAVQQRIAVLGLIQSSLETNQRKANVYYDFEVPRYQAMQRGHFIVNQDPHPLCHWLGLDFMHDVALVEFEQSPDAVHIEQLSAFRRLKEVVIHKPLQETESLKLLAESKALEKLTLCIADQTGSIPFESLRGLPRFSELVLKVGTLTQKDLSNISQCRSLQTLRLLNIEIEANDLQTFPEFNHLRNFFWRNQFQDVSDNEICFVKKLPRVEKIAFAGRFPITDESLQSFAHLSYLQELSLHGTQITGRHVGVLKSLGRLSYLELGAGPLNDDGLSQIASLSGLEHLEIGSTEVSDDGMPFVARLKKLRHLSIRDTQVTDSGLAQLQSLKRISFLRLKNSRVTSSGIAKFQAWHPDCVIEK